MSNAFAKSRYMVVNNAACNNFNALVGVGQQLRNSGSSCIVILNGTVIGTAMISVSSSNIRACISSGQHDLLVFMFFYYHLSVILGTSSSVSCLKIAFSMLSLSSNLSELLSFSFSSKGDTPLLVFNFLRVWDQKALGIAFDSVAIPFSIYLLS